MNLSHRIDEPEIMDTVRLSLPQMRETLNFLSLTNKYFGGAAAILNYLKKCSRQWKKGEHISLLDIGTGKADIPVAIARWAAKENWTLHITAIDLVPEIVAIAKETAAAWPNIRVEQVNFFDFLEQGKSFDYVISSLLLHHIAPGQNKNILLTMDKLSKRGIIISDLLRSPASYRAVSLLSYLIGNDIVRKDGPLSVRRAFQLDELNEMAREAGLSSYLSAQQEPWFRVSLSGEKKHGSS